jgi:hypothetical protein
MHYLKRYARHVDLLEFRRAHALSAIWRGEWFVNDVKVFRDSDGHSELR